MTFTVLDEEHIDAMERELSDEGAFRSPPSDSGETGAHDNSEATGSESDGFSFEEFLEWLGEWAGKIGKTLLEKALVAWYVAIDDRTPDWAKGPLIGALVYLGFPIDAVSDFVPFVGFADDAMVLALALAAVVTSVRLRHVRQARHTMRTWGIDVRDPGPDRDDDEQASPTE